MRDCKGEGFLALLTAAHLNEQVKCSYGVTSYVSKNNGETSDVNNSRKIC